MSEFSRIGIPLGIDSTIREDLAKAKTDIQQGVSQLTQAARVQVAPGAAAASNVGGSYNPIGSAAVNQAVQHQAMAPGADPMRRRPFDVEAYKQSIADKHITSIIDRRGVLQTYMEPDDARRYHEGMSAAGIREGRRQHYESESARIRGLKQQEKDENWYVNDQIKSQKEDLNQRRRDQDRQNKDENFVEKRETRNYRRADEAELRMRVSQRWFAGGRAREYESYAKQFDEGSPEFTRNMARAQEERNRGFFGRPQGRMLSYQVMFGAWEVGRALQGASQVFHAASVARTPEEMFSMQQSGLSQMQGGILGQVASIPWQIGDLLAGPKGFSLSLGNIKADSPAAQAWAWRGAMISLDKEQNVTEANVSRIQLQGQLQRAERAVELQGERRSLHQALNESRIQYDEATGSIQDEGKALNVRLSGTKDEVLRSKIQSDINVYNQFSKQRMSLAQNQWMARNATIAGDYSFANEVWSIGAGGATDEANFIAKDMPFTGRMAMIRAQQSMQLAEARRLTPERVDTMQKMFDAQNNSERHLRDNQRRLINMQLNGQAEQLDVLLGNAPGTKNLTRSTRTYLGEVIALRAQGVQQAEQFRQQEMGGPALQSLINTQNLLSLRRQDFLSNIRGQEFDFRHRDLSNPRDTENLDAILEGFQKAQKQLSEDIERIMNSLVIL